MAAEMLYLISWSLYLYLRPRQAVRRVLRRSDRPAARGAACRRRHPARGLLHRTPWKKM